LSFAHSFPHRHYKSLDDKILISEWKTTEKDLFEEMTVVNDLKNIVQGLKVCFKKNIS